MFAKFTNYFVQSFNELKKVNWPKRADIIRLTIIVIVSTLVAMAFVVGLDWVLSKIINYLIMK